MYRTMRQTFKYAAFGLTALVLLGCGSAEDRAKAYYESGSKYLEQKEYEKAAVEFRNALKIKEDYADAWYGMYKVEEHNQDWPRVIGDLTKVIEVDRKYLPALQALAKYNLLAGDFQKALANANTAYEIDPNNADVVAVKAAVQMKSGDRNGAVDLAKKALQLKPNHPDATILIATDLVESKSFNDAARITEAAIAANPASLGLHLLRIRIAELSSNLPDQEKSIRAIVAAFPEEKQMKEALTRFLVKNGRADEAEKEYRAAAQDPDDVEANSGLVSFLLSVRGPEVAVTELKRLITAAKKPFSYELQLADVLYSQNEKPVALDLLRKLSKAAGISDDGIAARLSLAGKLLDQRQYGELETVLGEVIANDARNIAALKIRGAMRIEKGELEPALNDLREALSYNHDDNSIRLLLASAYERKASYELAAKELVDAYNNGRSGAEVGLAYAGFLLRRGSFDRAEDILADVLAVSPRNRQVMGLLADLRIRKGDWKGAEALAKMAKDTTGDTLIAEKIMGASLAGQGKYDEAIGYFQKAAAASPTDLQPMFALVRSQIKAGKMAEAEAFANSMITANPNNPASHILNGAVQLAQNHVAEAKASYEMGVTKGPQLAQAYLALSEFYQKQNDEEKAAEVLNVGLTKVKDLNDIRMALASIYERSGRIDDAINLYEAIVKEQPNATIAVNNLVSLLTDGRDDPATLARAADMATVLRDSPIPFFRETLGWALVRQGNVKAGLPILEQTIAKLDNNAMAHYHLGMAYSADGSKSLAAKHLKTALDLEKIGPNRERIIRALEIIGP